MIHPRAPRGRNASGAGLPLLLLAGVLVAVLASPAGASRDEYEVKAAFLLNFARLVEWPEAARPAPTAPMVISVWGSPEVERAIARGIGAATVGEHPLVVRRIAGADELGGSHILFVSRDADASPGELLEAARRHATLAVGESEGFAARGGAINFFTENRKLRFEINPDAAQAASLKISSRLLRLAVLVGSGR
jgi:hypothetical protein